MQYVLLLKNTTSIPHTSLNNLIDRMIDSLQYKWYDKIDCLYIQGNKVDKADFMNEFAKLSC